MGEVYVEVCSGTKTRIPVKMLRGPREVQWKAMVFVILHISSKKVPEKYMDPLRGKWFSLRKCTSSAIQLLFGTVPLFTTVLTPLLINYKPLDPQIPNS